MAGALTIDTLNAGSGVLATQNGMTGICKAFVNFTGGSTPSINQSFNVSSVTNLSTGDYVVNFTTGIGNTTYVASMSAEGGDSGAMIVGTGVNASTSPGKTSTAYRFQTCYANGSQVNPTNAALAVFSS